MAASGTLYAVLGARRGASAAEVRARYHRLCLQLHPDTRGGHRRGCGVGDFVALQEAYAVLGDPARRRAYDRSLGGPGRTAAACGRGGRAPVRPAGVQPWAYACGGSAGDAETNRVHASRMAERKRERMHAAAAALCAALVFAHASYWPSRCAAREL